MTAVTEKPKDLGQRLQLARKEEAPLREQVGRLESDLTLAVAESRYADADRLQAELVPARQEAAIASATVKALTEAQGVIDAQRAADAQEVNLQRQRDEARAGIEIYMAEEARQLDEVDRHIAAANAGLAAVRQSLQQAVAAEQAAGSARQQAHNCFVAMGEREPTRVGRPNRAAILVDGTTHRVFQAIYLKQGW